MFQLFILRGATLSHNIAKKSNSSSVKNSPECSASAEKQVSAIQCVTVSNNFNFTFPPERTKNQSKFAFPIPSLPCTSTELSHLKLKTSPVLPPAIESSLSSSFLLKKDGQNTPLPSTSDLACHLSSISLQDGYPVSNLIDSAVSSYDSISSSSITSLDSTESSATPKGNSDDDFSDVSVQGVGWSYVHDNLHDIDDDHLSAAESNDSYELLVVES